MGAGLVGRRHIEEVDASSAAELTSIVDPGRAGPELAEKFGAPLFSSLAGLFATDRAGRRHPRHPEPAARRGWVGVRESLERSDPLARQVEHFAAVARGEAQPVVGGRDGLKTLRVVDAVAETARTGGVVETCLAPSS